MTHLINIFLHDFGLDDGSGAWYLFWSGICGDLIYLSIVVGLYRHLTCHADGCRRVGLHHVVGTPFKVCRRHHPTGGNTVETIHAAHHAATTVPPETVPRKRAPRKQTPKLTS